MTKVVLKNLLGNTLIATFTSKLVALASGVPISFWFTEEFITVVSAVIGPIAHGTLFNLVQSTKQSIRGQ